MTPLYDNQKQKLSYLVLDDIVFPVRDFIEALFFSYLFFFQIRKKRNLEIINEEWKKSTIGENDYSKDFLKDKNQNVPVKEESSEIKIETN